jgi:nucleoside-diphosphate-sugar epimerase
MRILLTGASSFSGAWFARTLAAAGHQVTAVLGSAPEAYGDPLRRARVAWGVEGCEAIVGPRFGDDAFLSLLRARPFDLLAHHGAMVTNYKSPDFDTSAAVAENTRNLSALLDALKANGGRRVLLTGSVFEGGEGAGSEGLPDFSPYGLSKSLTSRMFAYYCRRAGVHLGKFVIPNPFGAWEEPRFTGYCMRAWLKGETAVCGFPLNVRDNIHVGLLAKAYAAFAEGLPETPGFSRLNPSGYPESQGAFTVRLAEAMRPRLGKPCAVELKNQTDFPEPMVRINTDVVRPDAYGFSEAAAWDEMARYYLSPPA